MPDDQKSTMFAPAGRECPEDVAVLHGLLRGHFIAQTLDALPVLTLLLNRCRQIVLANTQTLKAVGSDIQGVLGKRPGEAFGCVHSNVGPDGCGTSEFCSRCGAVRSILLGLEGTRNIQDCNLLRTGDLGLEALDLQVTSSPIQVEGHDLVMFCIQDQSDQKRRRTLERLFFHDMLNTVGGLRGLTGILSEEVPEALRSDAEFIHEALRNLVDELLSQKDLLAAENNELTPVFVPLSSMDILNSCSRMVSGLAQSGGKAVEVMEGTDDVEFVSDPILVKRVIVNMLKNALEASGRGDAVRIGCFTEAGMIRVEVANPAVMTEDVRLCVFKRNFSTKGLGRGLGTYGMKLITERYLGGQVGFTSREPEGTVFRLVLPASPPGVDILGLGSPDTA